jgi:hypothetical protein
MSAGYPTHAGIEARRRAARIWVRRGTFYPIGYPNPIIVIIVTRVRRVRVPATIRNFTSDDMVYSSLPLCRGRSSLLVAWHPSEDLLDRAKDLFIEAQLAANLANRTFRKVRLGVRVRDV